MLRTCTEKMRKTIKARNIIITSKEWKYAGYNFLLQNKDLTVAESSYFHKLEPKTKQINQN